MAQAGKWLAIMEEFDFDVQPRTGLTSKVMQRRVILVLDFMVMKVVICR